MVFAIGLKIDFLWFCKRFPFEFCRGRPIVIEKIEKRVLWTQNPGKHYNILLKWVRKREKAITWLTCKISKMFLNFFLIINKSSTEMGARQKCFCKLNRQQIFDLLATNCWFIILLIISGIIVYFLVSWFFFSSN